MLFHFPYPDGDITVTPDFSTYKPVIKTTGRIQAISGLVLASMPREACRLDGNKIHIHDTAFYVVHRPMADYLYVTPHRHWYLVYKTLDRVAMTERRLRDHYALLSLRFPRSRWDIREMWNTWRYRRREREAQRRYLDDLTDRLEQAAEEHIDKKDNSSLMMLLWHLQTYQREKRRQRGGS